MPTVAGVNVMPQVSELRVQLPNSVVPSLKITEPVTGSVSVTVAVKVRDVPTVADSTEAIKVAVVVLALGLLTVCVTDPLLARYVLLPP